MVRRELPRRWTATLCDVTKDELIKMVEQAQAAGQPLLMPVEFYQQHQADLAMVYQDDASLLDNDNPSLPELQICGPAQNVQLRDGVWVFVADRLPLEPERGQ